MTPIQLKEILGQYGLEMYADTGGIYSKNHKYFLGSVDPAIFAREPITVTRVSLITAEVQAEIDLQKIIRSVCVMHDIEVKAKPFKGY